MKDVLSRYGVSTVSTTWFVGGIAKEVLHAAGKTGYQDRHALFAHSARRNLTSRMVYWFKIPIINL